MKRSQKRKLMTRKMLRIDNRKYRLRAQKIEETPYMIHYAAHPRDYVMLEYILYFAYAQSANLFHREQCAAWIMSRNIYSNSNNNNKNNNSASMNYDRRFYYPPISLANPPIHSIRVRICIIQALWCREKFIE